MINIGEILTIEEKIKRYAEIKIQIKDLEEGIETLKPFIVEHLESNGVDKLPTSLGNFTLGKRSSWKYTKAVDELQAKEKAEGLATQVVSTTLTFTQPKIEEENV